MKRQSFQKDWLFGKNIGAMRKITLPHDAMQEEGRGADAPSGTGGAFFLGGRYIYEKHFFVPKEWKNKTQILEFEGVYPKAEVFLNGKKIAGCRYGYSDFYVPLTELEYEAENVVQVQVDNSELPNSRWYSGAGIYRPVWLWTGNKEYIVPNMVRVTTLDYKTGRILIDTETTKKDTLGENLEIQIFEEDTMIAHVNGCHAEVKIENVRLWSDKNPFLYRMKVILKDEKQILDVYETSFGVRQIEYSNKGLFINGESVLLKGGCIHHDNGILGARSFAESEWRRIKRLKEFGFNAVRSSHNPLCKAALEACDALGMYVMDEAWDMWDKPKTPYDYANSFMENYESDIQKMVYKDYNHPSVIMYSIGNEVTEPSRSEGVDLAKKLVKTVKKYDQTRPVTAGINLTLLLLASMGIDLTVSGSDTEKKDQETKKEMNSTEYNRMVFEQGNSMTMAAASPAADKISAPLLDCLDICGYNYAMSRYEMEKELHPKRVVVGSETYPYDLQKSWKMVEKNQHIIGEFMWSAWDYLGEVGIGSWAYVKEDGGFEKKYPWLLADTGALDILGNDNAEAGIASIVWKARKTPYIAVTPANHPGIVPLKAIWRGTNALPYWSYQNCDGNAVEIQIYADAEEVEVFLNGTSIGRKEIKDYAAVFETFYQSGTIKAIAYGGNGEILSESELQSADSKLQIQILEEENPIKKNMDEMHGVEDASMEDGKIVYLDIDIVGSNGVVECNADEKLSVGVEGGELLAFGSANPKTEEDFLEGTYKTYYGRSQAVIHLLEKNVKVTVQGETLAKKEYFLSAQRG